MAGGWFSDSSLRVQWRLAQAVVGFPVALWLAAWAVVLVAEPGAAWDWLEAALMDPRTLLPLVGALGFVLWVDRHLERSKPQPPAVPDPTQST